MEYEGTNYNGFQKQPGRLTIQGELEAALEKLIGEQIRLKAASRTDAGVHAKGQVVSFKTGVGLRPETYVKGLNHYLPDDIAVRASSRIERDFDVRRQALCREYRYTILNSRTRSPLLRRFAFQVTRPLDLEAMRLAYKDLEGTHDFAPFSGPLPIGRSCVRTLYKTELRKEGEKVLMDIVAGSFLPQQVRRTVGALIRVGMGKLETGDFKKIATSGRQGVVQPTAPARGLCLMKINYREELFQA